MQDVSKSFGKIKAPDAPMRWFRMYSEFATDPKVQMLSEAEQRRYMMLLCLRCSNGDVTLQDAQCAFQMRISDAEYAQTKAILIARGLIDEANQPLAWERRQYLSDTSATRVQKHRQKRREAGLTSQDWISPRVRKEVFDRDANACVYCSSGDDLCIDHKVPVIRGGNNSADNLQAVCRTCNADKRNMTHEEYLNWDGRVTLLKRPQSTDTDTDTEVEKKIKSCVVVPLRANARRDVSTEELDLKFEEFWKSFPAGRKKGKGKAKVLFRQIARGGHHSLKASAEHLIAAAKAYAAISPDPQFTPMPQTWLAGGRWDDDLEQIAAQSKPTVAKPSRILEAIARRSAAGEALQ